MQEQDHFKEEQCSINQARQAEHIISFQEVVYPPPRWKRVLVSTFQFIWKRLLPATSQFILGAGVGLGLVWTTLIRGGTQLGCIIFMALFGITIACLCSRKTRFLGFGLLASMFAIPIIIAISCTVLHPGYGYPH